MDIRYVLTRKLLLYRLVVTLFLTLKVEVLVQLLPIVLLFHLVDDLFELERLLSLDYAVALLLNVRDLALLLGKTTALNLAPVLLSEVVLVLAVFLFDHVAVVLLSDYDLRGWHAPVHATSPCLLRGMVHGLYVGFKLLLLEGGSGIAAHATHGQIVALRVFYSCRIQHSIQRQHGPTP